MTWNINAIGNPHSMGRGMTIQLHDEAGQVSVACDEYDGHGVTLALGSDDVRIELGDTDEGMFLEIHGIDEDGCSNKVLAMVCLPMSLQSFVNEIDVAHMRHTDPSSDTEFMAKVIPFAHPFTDNPDVPDEAPDAHLDRMFEERFEIHGSDIDAPWREDYEPSPYDGTYSED